VTITSMPTLTSCRCCNRSRPPAVPAPLGWKVDGRWVAYYHPGALTDAWRDDHAGIKKDVYESCYLLGINIIFYFLPGEAQMERSAKNEMIVRRLALSLLLLLLLGPTSQAGPLDEMSLDRWAKLREVERYQLNIAEKLYREKSWKIASDEYEKFLKLYERKRRRSLCSAQVVAVPGRVAQPQYRHQGWLSIGHRLLSRIAGSGHVCPAHWSHVQGHGRSEDGQEGVRQAAQDASQALCRCPGPARPGRRGRQGRRMTFAGQPCCAN